MFFADNLKEAHHCFFSRLGGASKDNYYSLNCGLGSADTKKDININRGIVSKYFDLNPSQLLTLHQTHSNKIKTIDSFNQEETYLYDGVVTKQKNLILGILTADCAPILFYDRKNKIAGACHAGWRGAFSGIIENTINAMKKLGSNNSDIKCCIGPCIGEESYQVRNDFYNTITLNNIQNKVFFDKITANKFNFRLREFITHKLNVRGIGDISSIKLDTYTSDELFFSYRRSVHKKEDDYGRMISTIVIKD